MKKRKLLIGTLLATFACSLVGAVCSITPWQVSAETNGVVRDAAAVYDLYDITGETSFTSGSSKNRNIGQMHDTHNVAFRAKVSYAEAATKNLYMNFILGQNNTVNSAYYCNNYGYQFLMSDGAAKLRYDADPTTATTGDDTVGASLSWTELATKLEMIDNLSGTGKISTANFKTGKESFMFEFGSVKEYTDSVWTGNYVYAKINDVEVMGFTDSSDHYKTKGTYFGKGATGYDYTYYTFETAYDVSKVEKQVAVYDLYDITGKTSGTYINGTGYDGKYIGQFPYSSGVAFKTEVSAHADNTASPHLIDLVAMGGSAYTSENDYNGYRLYWRDNSIKLKYDKDAVASTGDTVAVSVDPRTIGLTAQNSCSASFVLEFGAARYVVDGEWLGNYVYVKVDGVEILHFVDKGACYKNRGHYVGSGAWGGAWSKYTFSSTYEDVQVEEAVVYDLYDLTGKTSGTYLNNYDGKAIANMSANSNVAFKTKVSAHEDNTLALVFLDLVMFSGESEGYQLYWRDNGLRLRYNYDFNPGANTAGENTAVSYSMSANYPNENKFLADFTLEFGSRKYVVDGEWAGNYVYAKINDVEVAHFVDKIDGYKNMGTKLLSGPWSGHAKYTFSTTYEDKDFAYKLLDAFTMENGASTRSSGNGLRFTMQIEEGKWTELQQYIGEDKVYSSVSFGMVIVPADYVAAKPLTVENLFGNSAVYHLMEKEADGSWKEYNGNLTPIFHLTGDTLTDFQFRGAIVNLEDWNITRNFVGLGYVKYVENGAVGYVLADYYQNDIANNTRSMYQVAKAAYEAGEAIKDQLKKNYLDKVSAITVNYFDENGETLLTETIYGVIGETAFAQFRTFDGYTFNASDDRNVIEITVSETESENVLNYYFAANN